MSHIVTPHSTSDFFFRVADTVFHLSFSDRTDARALIPSYAPFYIETLGDSPLLFDFSVDTDLVTISPTSNPIGTFDCGGIGHTIYSIDEGYKILISGLNGKVACAMEAINGFTQCRATLFGEQSDQAFGLNNALMIAFTFAGAFHNILLIHSSVTIKDERAYLFLGKSGTGKSTHSSLWHQHIPGSELLNDDNPAIRITPRSRSHRIWNTMERENPLLP